MTAPVKEATGTKRFNLTLPEQLYQEMQRIADEQNTTVVELLRRFVKLGLLAIKLQESPDSGLIVREGNQEHKVMLL